MAGKTRTTKAAAPIGAKKQVAQIHMSKLQEGKGVRRKVLVEKLILETKKRRLTQTVPNGIFFTNTNKKLPS